MMQISDHYVKPFKYDAFLCFRGFDTRYTFTGHLYKALEDRGFPTFMDDQRIDRGSRIPEKLKEAIEESRVFIIVLSENFASSSWCLDEVDGILAAFDKGKGQWVLPIFYYVDPADLADTYKDALEHHKERINAEKIEKWRTALKKLLDFFHLHLKRDENIREYEYIEHILKEVSRHVPSLVGLDHRISKFLPLLKTESDCVHMIGISGEAGIGKTTLALGVYNSIGYLDFDYYCFSDNVGENSSQSRNVDQRMSILKGKKAFMIFDNIKHSEQLENIIELTKQLSRSTVIIITQDKGLLDKYGIKNIYEVEKFSNTEAYELLMLKAFNSESVSPNFVPFLSRVATYALGHPWTLEVIGSILNGIPIKKWESMLRKFESISDRDIQKILEESFNSLEKCQQEMLIHIGCLKGLELVDVEAKLRNKFNVCPRRDIRVLLDKSLIKINRKRQVTLHTSTLDMLNMKNNFMLR